MLRCYIQHRLLYLEEGEIENNVRGRWLVSEQFVNYICENDAEGKKREIGQKFGRFSVLFLQDICDILLNRWIGKSHILNMWPQLSGGLINAVNINLFFFFLGAILLNLLLGKVDAPLNTLF